MGASAFEQNLAKTSGVAIQHWVVPKSITRTDNGLSMELEKSRLDDSGRLQTTGESMTLAADVIFKAIGQKMANYELDGIDLERGRIKVDDDRSTTLAGVWAGGDCVVDGEDLTVSAVQDGKVAALAIDRSLRNG
jgi:glutamate synthase (NADPH/NADH) small chain